MTAFVFSGQGAQVPGMGRDLYEKSEKAREVFELVEKVIPGIKRLCFESSKEELNETVNTQPCVFTVDLAAAYAVKEAGIEPESVAGFSLGEIAALAFAEVLEFEDACRLVSKRAELMHKDALEKRGSMAAVLGMEKEEVLYGLKGYESIEAVNFNCPGQIVVSGREDEIERYMADLKKNGKKARKLSVSGAFHSSFMNNASDKMGEYLKSFNTQKPKMDVYSNLTAQPYPDDEKGIKENIKKQINNPVRWEETIRNMISRGIDTFIEVGEGKVLCGLIGRIDSSVKVFHYTDILNKDGGNSTC